MPRARSMRRTAGVAAIAVAVVVLAACGRDSAGTHASGAHARPASGSAVPSRLDVLRGGSAEAGFARADAVRRFEFPRDEGPHPAYRDEWWYFTGHLRSRDGERFGFELTFFRVALAADSSSDASSRSSSSHWRARQLYVAHFAVTDIDRGTFHSSQRFARDALGLAGARAAPFRVWLGGWSVGQQKAGQRNAGQQPVADRNDAAGGRNAAVGRAAEADWTLRASDPKYGLTLQLHPLSAPVLNGDRGLSIKSGEPGAASYYYSIPRIAVRGQLVRYGSTGRTSSATRRLEVSGTAWLDREWGSGALGAHQQGWDWYALQLSDGSALMFYALRDDDGGRDAHSAGTWIEPDGSSRPLASRDVRIDVLNHWTSPRGARYPSRWRVRVDSLGLDVTATPVLADQELDTTPRYWEGDVDVAGARRGRRLSGQGYVELVGYGGR